MQFAPGFRGLRAISHRLGKRWHWQSRWLRAMERWAALSVRSARLRKPCRNRLPVAPFWLKARHSQRRLGLDTRFFRDR